MNGLELIELTRSFGDRDVVHRLSLVVNEGEVVALLGPSGSGKTSTLKMVAGLLRPTEGDIRWRGRSITSRPPEQRDFAVVFQEPYLFSYMTVGENVGFGLRMRRVPPAETRLRVAKMLQLVGLEGMAERRPGELSGGEQHRAALARALIVGPRVLLLDEPLTNLDPHLREGMRELILEVHRDLQLATIFVTHDQVEAVGVADRIVLVFEGRLHQEGAPRDFYERPASVRIAEFFGNPNLIPALRSGDTAHTALGLLSIAGGAAGDGPVTLTIRPEAVQIGGEAGPENTFEGRITSVAFRGDRTAVQLELEGLVLASSVTPDHASTLSLGDTVKVTLPQPRLWAVPDDVRKP